MKLEGKIYNLGDHPPAIHLRTIGSILVEDNIDEDDVKELGGFIEQIGWALKPEIDAEIEAPEGVTIVPLATAYETIAKALNDVQQRPPNFVKLHLADVRPKDLDDLRRAYPRLRIVQEGESLIDALARDQEETDFGGRC